MNRNIIKNYQTDFECVLYDLSFGYEILQMEYLCLNVISKCLQ